MAITKATSADLSRQVQNKAARDRIKVCLDALVDACNGTLPSGFLSADTEGRAAMATGYFNEATATDKFAAAAITTALLKAGIISADATGRALFAAGVINEATATSAIAAGALTTALLKAGIISADATGRALFANDFFDAATAAAVFAAGAFGASADGRAILADDYLDATTVARVVDAKAIDTGSIADSAIEALQLNAEAVTEPKVAPSILTGKHMAVGAAGNTVGVVPQLFIVTVPDGSTVLDALTLDATYGKISVTDVYFIKGATTGGASDAVQLCTDSGGTTAVSSSLALNTIAEGGVVRTTSLTNTSFNAGAHFYVKRTSTTNNSGTLVVLAYRVA